MTRRVKNKLKEDLGETSLKELKSEVKTMIRKVQKTAGDDEFEEMINHLVKLKDKLNKKIDDLKKKSRKQNQQPKGKLPSWDALFCGLFPGDSPIPILVWKGLDFLHYHSKMTIFTSMLLF